MFPSECGHRWPDGSAEEVDTSSSVLSSHVSLHQKQRADRISDMSHSNNTAHWYPQGRKDPMSWKHTDASCKDDVPAAAYENGFSLPYSMLPNDEQHYSSILYNNKHSVYPYDPTQPSGLGEWDQDLTASYSSVGFPCSDPPSSHHATSSLSFSLDPPYHSEYPTLWSQTDDGLYPRGENEFEDRKLKTKQDPSFSTFSPLSLGHASHKSKRFIDLPAPQEPSEHDRSEHLENYRDDVEQPYAQLIWQALLTSPTHSLQLQDIYDWIQQQTDKVKDKPDQGWRNSIRHNLSMNKAFEKQICESKPKKTGKNVWRLVDEFVHSGPQSTTRYRRKEPNFKRPRRNPHPAPKRQASGAKGGHASRKSAEHRRSARLREALLKAHGAGMLQEFDDDQSAAKALPYYSSTPPRLAQAFPGGSAYLSPPDVVDMNSFPQQQLLLHPRHPLTSGSMQHEALHHETQQQQQQLDSLPKLEPYPHFAMSPTSLAQIRTPPCDLSIDTFCSGFGGVALQGYDQPEHGTDSSLFADYPCNLLGPAEPASETELPRTPSKSPSNGTCGGGNGSGSFDPTIVVDSELSPF